MCVADAARQVGKKVRIQVERVLDGVAYATLVSRTALPEAPITAEGEAEKPTRRSAAKAVDVEAKPTADEPEAEVHEPEVEEAAVGDEPAAAPKKKTRRGTRGGRGRKRKTAVASSTGNGAGEPQDVAPVAAAKIHLPEPELGEPTTAESTAAEPVEDGAEPSKPKKKTRRGSRGGRGRKKKSTAAVVSSDGAERSTPPEEDKSSEWEYVPMSEWDDEIDAR